MPVFYRSININKSKVIKFHERVCTISKLKKASKRVQMAYSAVE